MLQALLIVGPKEEIEQIWASNYYIILSGKNDHAAFILIAAGARIYKTSTLTITPIILDLTDTLSTNAHAA